MRNKDLKPTEPFPKILWYSVKRTPSSDKERQEIFNRYYQAAVNKFTRKFVNSPNDQVDSLAKEQAERMTDSEINKPAQLKKVVADNYMQYQTLVETIESSDDFIEWYEK
jgi:AAA15 family ATPase/GTPase